MSRSYQRAFRMVLSALLLASAAMPSVQAQDAAADGATYAIVHAELHNGDGEVLRDATIEIRDGRISKVEVGGAPSGYAPEQVIDAKGHPVTPGLTVVGSPIGLVEIEAESSTDDAEGRPEAINASIRAADGFNPESTLIAVATRAGVTSAVVVPSGGLVQGTAAWVDLAGELRAALPNPEVAIFVDLGGGGQSHAGGTRPRALSRLRELLEDARLFKTRTGAFDRRQMRVVRASRADLEQMVKVLDRELPLVVHVDRAVDILRVLELAENYQLRLVLSGVREGWRVAADIAEAKVPVIVRPLSNLPSGFSELGSRYDNASLLHKAGVTIMLTAPGAHDARMIRQELGNAVAWGLPWEVALSAVTRVPAEVFGTANTGVVAPGNVADVVVWTADPFEVSSWASHVFIAGQLLKRKSRQERLFERYRDPF